MTSPAPGFSSGNFFSPPPASDPGVPWKGHKKSKFTGGYSSWEENLQLEGLKYVFEEESRMSFIYLCNLNLP